MAIYDPGQQPSWNPPVDQPAPGAAQSEPQLTTSGDRWAIAALAIVGTSLISCIPGLNCLAPLVPLIVGIVTLTKAKTAVDPSRARLYGWLAVGLGSLFLLALISIIALYGTIFAALMRDPRFQQQLR
ncbi:MAG TPA: hypothetical protein PLO33_04770 [Kouleothrix sp.]|uniref:hypothetical protein n=1 Tax=Kouleothrix sp. TaxID=2779161 RepID=UPI002C0CBA3B|nr:hypothetical protein [Kouleothrix sp.]HRC74968.1 hypothetical protein [Kouleothrix sp.]